jgi:uncharacterized membrane protein YfcA
MVYAVVLHLRLIPKLNNHFTLSSMALVSMSSVIMTFLGVNYYLSGMHSYGKGTPPPVPTFVYLLVLVIFGVIIGAYFSQKKRKF